jgi:hypothetical protein
MPQSKNAAIGSHANQKRNQEQVEKWNSLFKDIKKEEQILEGTTVILRPGLGTSPQELFSAALAIAARGGTTAIDLHTHGNTEVSLRQVKEASGFKLPQELVGKVYDVVDQSRSDE